MKIKASAVINKWQKPERKSSTAIKMLAAASPLRTKVVQGVSVWCQTRRKALLAPIKT
ncbi:MAG: hypothetical protein K9J74_12785 [Sulfuritalea sp.]|nr:hypothetical protein [Sulfuritalea sp.]